VRPAHGCGWSGALLGGRAVGCAAHPRLHQRLPGSARSHAHTGPLTPCGHTCWRPPGSVMVTPETSHVIDPEFAFYGPIAFDVAKVRPLLGVQCYCAILI
jgi:hypothetical protein